MRVYKNLPEYVELQNCLKRVNEFKKLHEREYEFVSYQGKTIKGKKIFVENLSENELIEYNTIYRELCKVNLKYLSYMNYFNGINIL